MRVPVSIPIGGRRVTVSYPETVESDGEDAYADVDAHARLVRVSASSHKDEREVFESLFHELAHYALRKAGLATVLGLKLEEAVVECLEEKLGPILAFNPAARIGFKDVAFPHEDEG